jgi:hypothetical protein
MGEEEGAGRERDNGPGQEPFDGVRAVAASSVWPVICVTEVSARLRSLAIRRCSVLGVVLRCTPVGGDDHVDPGAGHLPGDAAAGEGLVEQERVVAGGVACGQVGAGLAFVDGGGPRRPGADDACARVSADGQAEAVEPFGRCAVPAGPGVQVVARAGPLPGAADRRGMPDRDRGGIDRLDGISGCRGCAGGAELLEGTRSQRVRR